MKPAVIFFCLLALVSCGPSFPWVKTWVGEKGLKARPGEDSAALGSVNHLQITIKDDGTYTMDDGGVPIVGDVSYSGDTAVLTPATVLGVKVSRSGPPYSSVVTLQGQHDGTAVFTRSGTPDRFVLR